MLNPIIQTQSGKVFLTYPSIPEFNLQMDFNPIIDWFGLRNKFCLLHWQAKPFGERRWGIYDAGYDRYTSLKYCDVEFKVIPQLLAVNELIVKTIPTAVLYFPESQLIQRGHYLLIPS
jgi:hypothetical protein